MQAKTKKILTLAAVVIFTVVAAKILINLSEVKAPLLYVVVAKNEIKIGDLINESSVETILVTASLVKSQAMHWSPEGLDESEISKFNSLQTQKILGKTATKQFRPGDQIKVSGIK